MIGTPTYIPDYSSENWYYINRTISRKAWFKPKVIQQRIVEVNFNKNNQVSQIFLLENSHNEQLAVNNSYTETEGTEKSGLQKFVKNLGRFTKTSKNKGKRKKK